MCFGCRMSSACGTMSGTRRVFFYLIVRSVAAMLYAESVGKRGVYLSLKLDLPTGATIVCTCGVVLALMAAVRPLIGSPKREQYVQHEPR